MRLLSPAPFLLSSILFVFLFSAASVGETVACAHGKCSTVASGSQADGESTESLDAAISDAINNLNPNHCHSCVGLGCIEVVSNNWYFSYVGEYKDEVYKVRITAWEGLEICTVCTLCILPIP